MINLFLPPTNQALWLVGARLCPVRHRLGEPPRGSRSCATFERALEVSKKEGATAAVPFEAHASRVGRWAIDELGRAIGARGRGETRASAEWASRDTNKPRIKMVALDVHVFFSEPCCSFKR